MLCDRRQGLYIGRLIIIMLVYLSRVHPGIFIVLRPVQGPGSGIGQNRTRSTCMHVYTYTTSI